VARPAQQSDRAPSPFESLLDDSAQTADQPTPPSPDNKAGPADSAQAPAKNKPECKAPPASDDTPAPKSDQPDAALKLGADGKPVCEDKADTNAKVTATAGDTIDAGEKDEKPTDAPKTDNPVIATPTDTVQTVSTSAAAVLAPSPVSDQAPKFDPADVNQPDPAAALVAAIGHGRPDPKELGPVDPKAGTGKQANGEKKSDSDTKLDSDVSAPDTADLGPATKVTPQSHADKPQLASGDSDKERVTQARGEGGSDSHRSMDTPGSYSSDPARAAPNVSADTSVPSPVVTETANSTPAATAPAAAIAQPPTPPVAIPFAGLAIEIAGKAMAGKNRFEIRLDPPELGRIEVRLDVDRDGTVTSRLTVDRADTFDLLRRDAAGLERALQDAGLKTAGNGLQFSLRDQSMNQQQASGGSDSAQLVVQDDMLPPTDVIPQNYGRLAGQGGGLDIRV
jgi:chemotaxis protein MotD